MYSILSWALFIWASFPPEKTGLVQIEWKLSLCLLEKDCLNKSLRLIIWIKDNSTVLLPQNESSFILPIISFFVFFFSFRSFYPDNKRFSIFWLAYFLREFMATVFDSLTLDVESQTPTSKSQFSSSNSSCKYFFSRCNS